MSLRAASLLAGAWTAGAQLLVQPPVDFEQLSKELEAEARSALLHEEPVPTSLQNPTVCDSTVKQYSGYLPVAPASKYFFWLFESQRNPSEDPLVLWLTGGPGCSSQLAMLAENGPCTVSKDGKSTIPNPYTWTKQANVMWVDQPTGTGFSVGPPIVHDQEGVAKNMFAFMKKFYETLPQYKSNAFYIFGESYGGHYVPAVAHYLWQQAKSGHIDLPLKGVAVGNGLTDPEEQYKWYAEMAFTGGKREGGTLEKGVVNLSTFAMMKAATPACVNQIRKCNQGNTTACVSAYGFCNMAELTPYEKSGYNPYDMRIKCEVAPLCYDFSGVTTFLNLPETQQQLGVNKTWESCNFKVNAAFQLDWMKNYHTKLPELLEDGVPVLIYAGDVDYVCNWLGNKKWTMAMQWRHKSAFNRAKDTPYVVGGKVAGRLRASHGLHFLQVFQAGHMVPMDQPEVALALLNGFLEGKLAAGSSPASEEIVV